MLGGEQPGDQEDRKGEPFVGPIVCLGATAGRAVLGRSDLRVAAGAIA